MHSKEQTRSLFPATRHDGRRVLAAVTVLLILAALLLVLSVVQSRRTGVSLRQNGFLLSDGREKVFSAAGNGLAAAGTDKIFLYSPAGKCVAEYELRFSRPMCTGGAAVSVYYDHGRAGFHALYPDGTHRWADTDGGVTFAEVNETGLITVILDIKDTNGAVMVFDTDLTALFRWDAGSGIPVSARVSADDTLCVDCVSDEGGALRFFQIDREEEQARFSLPGEIITDVGFLGNDVLAAVTGKRLVFVDTQGALIAEHPFGESHLDAFSLRGSLAAVSTVSAFSGGQGVLTTFDAAGQVLGSVSAPRHVESISSAGERLLVLFTGEEATLFEADLREIVSYQPGEGVDRIFLTRGGMAYFAGPEGVTQIDFGR